MDPDATTVASSSSQMAAGIHREESDDSDVVFVGEREVSRPSNTRPASRLDHSSADSRQNDGHVPRTQGGISGLGDIIREGTLGFFTRAIPMGVFPEVQRERHLPTDAAAHGRQLFLRALNAARRGAYPNTMPEPDFEIMADRRLRPTAPATNAGPQNFPAQLNFEVQGFELDNGFEDDVTFQGAATRNRPESPPYKAPSAPPEGFTRKLEEDSIVVCPNCNEELGRRDYDDLKKQVWVVKACGHVSHD